MHKTTDVESLTRATNQKDLIWDCMLVGAAKAGSVRPRPVRYHPEHKLTPRMGQQHPVGAKVGNKKAFGPIANAHVVEAKYLGLHLGRCTGLQYLVSNRGPLLGKNH
jgi:hypothetical protein